jgi:hypothetical protein
MANRVDITFNTDAVDGDKSSILVNLGGGILRARVANWKTVAGSDPLDLEIPTPTSNPGEASALALLSHFNSIDTENDSSYSSSLNVFTAIANNGAVMTTGLDGINVGDTTRVYSTDSTLTSVDANVLGQEFTNTATYCYLHEPLVASISREGVINTSVSIDLDLISTEDGTTYETIVDYGEFDMISNKILKVDLMEMARQYHDSKLYKLGSTSDIQSAWELVVSKYKYKFTVRFSDTADSYEIIKLPIIGGRDFQNFTPQVTQTTPLNEADKYGVDLTNKFIGYPIIETTLADPTLTDARPTITVTNQTTGCKVKKGVIWKSSLGGWMSWGFKLENIKHSHKYMGKLDVEIFESTEDIDGHIYKPVNYTGIETTSSTSLKSLSLSSDELKVVSGINFSPAVYYVTSDGKMELMRMSGANTPLDSKANGGDFSLNLKSIGAVKQSTI